MRRRIGLFLTISLGMLIVLETPRLAEAFTRAEIFRVVNVTVEGTDLVTREEVLAAAAIPPGASIWDDLAPATSRLSSHPLIQRARIRRFLTGRLVVQVDERRPVALLPRPALTPVDVEAQVLPISPAERRMDLPILQPRRQAEGPEAELTPAQLRLLTRELDRLARLDPALLASVSEVALDGWGDVLLHLDEPRVTLRYRAPLVPARLNDGLRVLRDALEREPDRVLQSVDLRFSEQVVVRFADSSRR